MKSSRPDSERTESQIKICIYFSVSCTQEHFAQRSPKNANLIKSPKYRSTAAITTWFDNTKVFFRSGSLIKSKDANPRKGGYSNNSYFKFLSVLSLAKHLCELVNCFDWRKLFFVWNLKKIYIVTTSRTK